MSHQDSIGASSEVLLRALDELDISLAEKGIGKLEIKIVGGFALILQGVRDNGFTQDIDSMTKRFDADVSEAVAEIGKRLGIKGIIKALGIANSSSLASVAPIINDYPELAGKLCYSADC